MHVTAWVRCESRSLAKARQMWLLMKRMLRVSWTMDKQENQCRNYLPLHYFYQRRLDIIDQVEFRVRNSANPFVGQTYQNISGQVKMSVHGYPAVKSIFCNLQLGLLKLQSIRCT